MSVFFVLMGKVIKLFTLTTLDIELKKPFPFFSCFCKKFVYVVLFSASTVIFPTPTKRKLRLPPKSEL